MFKKKPKQEELKRKSVEQLIAEASEKLDQVLDTTDELIEDVEQGLEKDSSEVKSSEPFQPIDVENSLPDPIISLARETIENTIPALPEGAILNKEFESLDEVSGVYDQKELMKSEVKAVDTEPLPPLPKAAPELVENKGEPDLVDAAEASAEEETDFEELNHDEFENKEALSDNDFEYEKEIHIEENQSPLENIENDIDRGNFSDAFESDYRRSLSTKIKVLENILFLVNQKSDFRLMMAQVLEIIVQAFPSEAGSIIEIDYLKGDMFFTASKGACSEKLKKIRIPKSAGIAGFVVESGESYCTNRADEDTIHLDQISKSVGFHVKNIVCVPIKIQGRIYGVLELINKMGTENYDNEDVSTLNDIMNYISIVVENKLLFLNLNKNLDLLKKSQSKNEKAA